MNDQNQNQNQSQDPNADELDNLINKDKRWERFSKKTVVLPYKDRNWYISRLGEKYLLEYILPGGEVRERKWFASLELAVKYVEDRIRFFEKLDSHNHDVELVI